mmetsp:Transcript_36702/g.75247  ORF Transcript_36702/g.75247 Transcript_36702/m.75247 type:complete len:210 (+) Transcript_36702:119-748(+)
MACFINFFCASVNFFGKSMLSVTTKSPLPSLPLRPPFLGMPSPLMEMTCSQWVTSVRLISTLCPSKCSMTLLKPTRLSSSVIGKWICRSSPRRSKCGCGIWFTTNTRSPGMWPTASSATCSNFTVSPCFMPACTSTVSWISSSSVIPCGHALQLVFHALPRATQDASATCTCCTNPGASCCMRTLMPGPWQSLEFFWQLEASTHTTWRR